MSVGGNGSVNKYEALMIFDESLKDAALEEALGRIKAEILKLSGTVEGVTRLGRRPFARDLNKRRAGQYVLLTLRLDGAQVKPLLARLKLSAEVFRAQIVRADEGAGSARTEQGARKGGTTDGIA